jgi:hypothetical protein
MGSHLPTAQRGSAPGLVQAALIAAVMLTPAPMLGQSPARTTLPVTDLQADFALLRSAVTEAHAGLFVYESPRAIAHVFDSARAALHDTTRLGFYGVVAGVLAQIRDGHTRSLPSEEWMQWYADSARILPLRIRVADGRGWVLASADPGVDRGSEVLAISGCTPGQIAAHILSRLPGDGFIETGKLAALSEQFEFWFYLFESQADSFRVDVRRQGGDTTSRWIAAVPPSALREAAPDQHPPLALTFVEDSTTALLRIRTFAADEISGAGLNYPRFLDAAFSRIRDARMTDLILDLRGNDGGRDAYGARLLSHLSSRPFAYYRSLETRVDRVSFWRHTNVDSAFNIRFGTGLIRATNGTYQLPRPRHQNLGLQQPRAPVFTGRVWALIDGGTFSTAAEFCAVTQSLGRATFIGQETGGTYAGNTSGTFVILTLPRTGVRVVVPLVRYNLAVRAPRNPGRGVIPDHLIESVDVEGGDAFVALALQLIRRARGQ